jgi:heme/copper-type cytochrome/quinol oxidase subunit 2
MEWYKIGTALLLVAMMVMLYPRLKQASQNSPKATQQDWVAVVKPLVMVVLFVVVLIMLVR